MMDRYLAEAVDQLWHDYWEAKNQTGPIVILGYAPRPPKWINPARKRFPLLTNRQFNRRLR